MASIAHWKRQLKTHLLNDPVVAEALAPQHIEQHCRDAGHCWRDSFWSPSGCMSQYSKLSQKSNTLKYSFFPSGSQSLCLQALSDRVPLPSICQNLILENTGLAKTRLQTSGTSMPVSSISTDIATLGSDSVLNSLIEA